MFGYRCYRNVNIAANITAIRVPVPNAEHTTVPMLSIGAGSNGLPPTNGVGVSSSDEDDCTGSLVALDCAVFCVGVVSADDGDGLPLLLAVLDGA